MADAEASNVAEVIHECEGLCGAVASLYTDS